MKSTKTHRKPTRRKAGAVLCLITGVCLLWTLSGCSKSPEDTVFTESRSVSQTVGTQSLPLSTGKTVQSGWDVSGSSTAFHTSAEGDATTVPASSRTEATTAASRPTQTQTATKTTARTPTETRTQTQTETRTQAQTETRTQTQTETRTQTQTETRTQTQTETQTQTQGQTQTQTQGQTQTQTQGQTQTQTTRASSETEPPQQSAVKEWLEEASVTEPIPFETETRYSGNHYIGEETVLQEGEEGVLEITTLTAHWGSTVVGQWVDKTVKTEPIARIVLIGTKDPNREEVEVNVTEIPFERKTVYDPSLYEGTALLETKGENGTLTERIRITYYKGKETGRTVFSRERTEPTDEVLRVGTKPILTYETEEEESVLPFSSRSVEDSSLALGVREVRTEGQNGKETKLYQITYEKGVETQRVLLRTETQAPVEEVIAVGTYVAPAETFRMPYLTAGESKEGYVGHAYSVTQYFGNNGHGGMDIGVWYGNAVVAAMSGTVVMAYNEGDFNPATDTSMLWTYGTFVVIEHENGLRTYYAHLRIRWVSVGEKVTQGQIIGQAGNTGRVSPAPTAAKPYAGTHLHFEVREYNPATGKWVRKNPLDYLP